MADYRKHVSVIAPPSTRQLYRTFEFIGVKDLRELKGPPAHRSEVGLIERDADERVSRHPTYCGTESSGDSPGAESGWYVAEQLFGKKSEGAFSGEVVISPAVIERTMLIRATSESDARLAACEDASAFANVNQSLVGEFDGLGDIMLVIEPLVDGCELKSRIVHLTGDGLRGYIPAMDDLAAFRHLPPLLSQDEV